MAIVALAIMVNLGRWVALASLLFHKLHQETHLRWVWVPDKLLLVWLPYLLRLTN
jgi:hypothetical protein